MSSFTLPTNKLQPAYSMYLLHVIMIHKQVAYSMYCIMIHKEGFGDVKATFSQGLNKNKNLVSWSY